MTNASPILAPPPFIHRELPVPPLAVLVATANRPHLLRTRALASILSQAALPDTLVLVNDGQRLDSEFVQWLEARCAQADIRLQLLDNVRTRGPAGAWNSGLARLVELRHRGFVAILDDDDTWDRDHLAVNLEHAADVDLVVSGLRLVIDGDIVERPLVTELRDRDFLVGNPGWQGSNTFVRLKTLLDAGGFREGLASLHDRDLAIRLLRLRGARWRATKKWTASWFVDDRPSLSQPGSTAKRLGLRQFWSLYHGEMTPFERQGFLERAGRLFGIDPSEIVAPPEPAPALCGLLSEAP